MRTAACHCGALRLEVTGDPFAVSICNCLDCQRRTGSAFGMQAAFRPEQVEVLGEYRDFTRISTEPDRKPHTFHFCPACGSQVFYTESSDNVPSEPDLIVVSVGAFADPSFPPPTESSYDSRRHPWVQLPDAIQRRAPERWWETAHSFYEAGDYAGAAAAGRALIAEHPMEPGYAFNTACCESLAGETALALEHLRQAIEHWDGFRELARGDADFDALRSEPAFRDLVD